MKIRKSIMILLCCIGLLLTSNMYATVQKETHSGGSHIVSTGADFSTTLKFQKYHGALSDLQQIKITLNTENATGFWAGKVGLDNDNSSAVTGKVDFGLESTIRTSFGDETTANINDTNVSYSLGADDGDGAGYNDGGDDNRSYLATNIEKSSFLLIDSADFANYNGTGDFSITLNVAETFNIDKASIEHMYAAMNTSTVTVEYTTVPEPTSFMLFLIGGISFILRRRRK